MSRCRWSWPANPTLSRARTPPCNEVGLADRLKHYPAQMSGGEQQRVALARAMVANPSLLLADEPTGNLDQSVGAEIIELIFALNRAHGATLVLVTHDEALARRCHRIVRLRNGRIESDPRLCRGGSRTCRRLTCRAAPAQRNGLSARFACLARPARRLALLRRVHRRSRPWRHGDCRRGCDVARLPRRAGAAGRDPAWRRSRLQPRLWRAGRGNERAFLDQRGKIEPDRGRCAPWRGARMAQATRSPRPWSRSRRSIPPIP